MKKLIALILTLATLLLAVGCKKEKYPEIESTKEEARVMMTFAIGGEKYEMKYELYRALFLNLSPHYDKGDKSFWSTPESTEALAEINEKILEYTLDIFGVLHVAKSIGFDPYSKEAESLIADLIATSVEGDGDTVIGFGGDYDAYLDSLKKANMNYAVQKLLFRYSVSYDKILEYYGGTVNESNPTENVSGALSFTRDDVLNFYNSEDSVRVSLITCYSRERAETLRNDMLAAPSITSALKKAISMTTATPSDVLDGVLIGTHTLDEAYYSEVTKAAFDLELGSFSDIVTVPTENGTEYWILYKHEKEMNYFDNNYNTMADVFVSQKIGEIIEEAKTSLRATLSESEAYKNLNHSSISMK